MDIDKELEEQLRKILNSLVRKRSISESYDGIENTILDIKDLITTQVNQERIDELAGVRGWTEYEPDPKYSPAERFHIVPYTYLTKRIAELKEE